MRREDLELLRCPNCRSALELDAFVRKDDVVIEGALRCNAGCLFPIIDAIPRFAPGVLAQHPGFASRYADAFGGTSQDLPRELRRTSDSFGLQWRTYDVVAEEEDHATFYAKTGFSEDALGGALVLDAGCGGGRYARVATRAGARVVAVDLSRACEKAREVLAGSPNALVVQGNLMRLPLRREAFDAVYSIGVLHHTPNTRTALEAIGHFVRPGGNLAVWLYLRRDPLFEAVNRLLRGFTTRLSHRTLMRLARLAVSLGAAKRALLARRHTAWMSKLLPPCSSHPDPHMRVCDTFDWYSPQFQWHHTNAEVERWLRDLGFVNLKNLSEGYRAFHALQGDGVNFLAQKPATSFPGASAVSPRVPS